MKPFVGIQLVEVQPGQSRSGQAGSESCLSLGDWRGLKRRQQGSGPRGSSSEIFYCCDSRGRCPGRRQNLDDRKGEVIRSAGVPSPGHAFTGILQELGNTFQSPPARSGSGSPDSKGPGLGRYGCTGRRSEQASGGRGSMRSRATRGRKRRAGRSLMNP